jgi:peptide/nickel transport system substrate-binding protein
LRPNVRFADGTPMNSAAIKFDIQRRAAVNGGPAYMVAPVTSILTPSADELIVNLKTPENAFPSWLASPYGLKAVSPTAVKAHESGDSWAQKWLANNCAGTGAYTMSNAIAGQKYVLTANKYYWGTQPYFKTVDIAVIPSFSTQELELQSGGLDLMTHGIPITDMPKYENNPAYTVSLLPGISSMNLWIDPHKPQLADPQVREAIGMALDRPQLVQEVYGNTAVVYNGLFAPGTLPAQYNYKVPYNPSAAKAIMAKQPQSNRSVTLVYTTDNASNEQLAGLIAQQMNAVGFNVNLRGEPETEVFNYPSDPESKRPDMIVLPQNPDDASPSSFPQLQWLSIPNTGAFFPPFDPAADKVFEQAVITASLPAAIKLYGQAADMYASTYAMVPIANNKTVIVARKGITGIGVARQGLWTVDVPALRG